MNWFYKEKLDVDDQYSQLSLWRYSAGYDRHPLIRTQGKPLAETTKKCMETTPAIAE